MRLVLYEIAAVKLEIAIFELYNSGKNRANE